MIQKYFLLIFALWACSGSLCAQNYALQLQSGDWQLEANSDSFSLTASPGAEEIFQKRFYRIVQFYETPTRAEILALEATGLHILDYLPQRAYIVSFPVQYDRTRLQGRGIRSIAPFPIQQKIHTILLDRPLPEHVVPAPGYIDVVVTLHSDVSQMQAELAILEELEMEVLPGIHRGAMLLRLEESELIKLAEQPYVMFVEPVAPPSQPQNYTARTLHRSNLLHSDHPLGRKYDGTGVVVAIGDDGQIGPHIDYTGRTDQSNVSFDTGDHGDHVAGIIAGAGNRDPLTQGMAPGATLRVYDMWDNVNDAPFAYAMHGVVITSTAYSNGCNTGYTSFARTVDQDTRLNPNILHVFPAGNSGTTNCGYGAGLYWGNLAGGVMTGKNVLTVASVGRYSSLATSSSRGPAKDGRIKPDISANGNLINSTVPNHSYDDKIGTSMACSGAAGVTAQLYQAYRELNNGNDPLSGLIKGVIMNSADDINNPGPDFKTGYGQINGLRAVEVLENGTYWIDSISQGDSSNYNITVPQNIAKLKIMVYWHDHEASVNAAPALVNDIDMEVIDPAQQSVLPWVLNSNPSPISLNAPAIRYVDHLNNVEQVTIDNPVAGDYRIKLNGFNIPHGPQQYFVVYEMRENVIRVIHPNGGEKLLPGEWQVLRWAAEGNSGNFMVETSMDDGNTWNTITSLQPGNFRTYDYVVPVGMESDAFKIRVSRAGLSDESDYGAEVMPIPSNLQVSTACPTYTTLTWNVLSGALEYDVFMLGTKYMDSVGTTSNTTFTITNVDNSKENWFAVRARGASGANSLRSVAIKQSPGIFNCYEPNDAAAEIVDSPGQGILANCVDGINAIPVKVRVKNYSPNALSGVGINYQLDNGPIVSEVVPVSIPGFDSVVHTFNTPVDLSAPGNRILRAWVSFGPDVYKANDSTSAEIEVVAGISYPAPYLETFDTWSNCSTNSNCEATSCNFTAGWYQYPNLISDDIDFRTNNNGTPSSDTGPASDHTLGTFLGKYIYTEATLCTLRHAVALTPCIDLDSMVEPELRFYTHMNGTDMGEVHTDIFANGQWNLDVVTPRSGNWNNFWWPNTGMLTPYVGQNVLIRFRATTGPGISSDLAIDDVGVSETFVSNTPGRGQLELQVYPNPTTGRVQFAIAGLGAETVLLKLYDMQGRLVLEREEFTVGNHLIGELDLSNLSSGIYGLHLSAQDMVWNERIVLE